MGKPYPISRETLQRFLVNRSFLGNPASDLLLVLKFFRCLQVDPIDVVSRSHELALFNRVANFHKSDLQTALYQDRIIYEYWLQLFSLIPTEFYPQLSARRKIVDTWHHEFQTEHQLAINQAKQYIYQNGPSSSFELSHIKSAKSLFSWSDTQSSSALLDFLWDRGELIIHHRQNNRKYYDFAFRTLGAIVRDIPVSESRDWILESCFYYSGIVRSNIFNRVGYSRELKLRELFYEWIQTNRISAISIPGVSTVYYVLTSDLPKIESLGSQPISQKVNFLSPLDPLIIDRQLVKDIFNFDYIWEAYTPIPKRKFGYYGMPVLYHGDFIGQLDLKKDNSQLKVKNSTLIYPDNSAKNEVKLAFKNLRNFCFQSN